MDVEYILMKSIRISDITIGLDNLTETFDAYINYKDLVSIFSN